MNLLDIPRFLFLADREAILRLAASRTTLIVGPLLVLSASLARNYDGAYLPKEPGVLTHGLGASVFNAFVLFSIVYGVINLRRGVLPRFVPGFLSFLGLFWMTSPMAWLYGLPYEHWMPGVDAVRANLLTLAFVSVWRLLLITRVLSVLFGARFLLTLPWVLLFSDVVFFAAAALMPGPVIDIMGGLQQSEEDRLMGGVRLAVQVWAFILLWPLFLIALLSIIWLKAKWAVPGYTREQTRGRIRPGITLGVLAVAAWVPALLWSQPEQKRRYETDSLLRAGRVGEAFAVMSGRVREDYPPMWTPPPRTGWREFTPSIEAVREALETQTPATWVKHLFLDKSWGVLAERTPRWKGTSVQDLAENAREGYWVPEDADRRALRMHARIDDRLSEAERKLLEQTADLPKPW